MYKFHPLWQHVKDIVRTNQIGKITYIHTSFSYNNPSKTNIRNIKEYGGGAMMDIGCYAVSVPRFILDAEPNRVVSMISVHPEFGTDMLSSAIMDFGGTRATFSVGTLSESNQRVDIVGTAGKISIPLPFNTFVDVSSSVTVINNIGERVVTFEAVDQYGLMFDAFADAVLNGKIMPVDIEDAVKNQKAVDAVFRSGESEKWEKVT
jgi:predicted dehydrogenase